MMIAATMDTLGGATRLQRQCRIPTDVGSTKRQAWFTCEKVLYGLRLNRNLVFNNITHNRRTVQMLLSVMDGEGVKRRSARRLKRRVYQNRVKLINQFILG